MRLGLGSIHPISGLRNSAGQNSVEINTLDQASRRQISTLLSKNPEIALTRDKSKQKNSN
jgi:hypothetical protein